MKYTEKKLRAKCKAAGYRLEKGFQKYMYNDCVVPGRVVGYMVYDMSTGIAEYGCYNEVYTHLWSLEDVENFLINIYHENNLEF